MESPSAVFGEQELRNSFQGGSDTFSSNAYPSPTSGALGALEGLARVHPGVRGSQVLIVLLGKSQLDTVNKYTECWQKTATWGETSYFYTRSSVAGTPPAVIHAPIHTPLVAARYWVRQ